MSAFLALNVPCCEVSGLDEARLERLAGATNLGVPPESALSKRNNLYSWAYHRMEVKATGSRLDELAIKYVSRLKANRVVAEFLQTN